MLHQGKTNIFLLLHPMTKKAIIFDLDNTLYAVSSIAGELFAPLFQLFAESGEVDDRLQLVKQDIMRKPYQWVAAKHGFSNDLTKKGLDLLRNATYGGPIEPFADYAAARDLPVAKFLVTSGFRSMQQSKIRRMGIEGDFKEIHIVDVETSSKKAVFAAILLNHGYAASEVLVVGDDPESEIRAAQELGLSAVLYDKFNRLEAIPGLPKISDHSQLAALL